MLITLPKQENNIFDKCSKMLFHCVCGKIGCLVRLSKYMKVTT